MSIETLPRPHHSEIAKGEELPPVPSDIRITWASKEQLDLSSHVPPTKVIFSTPEIPLAQAGRSQATNEGAEAVVDTVYEGRHRSSEASPTLEEPIEVWRRPEARIVFDETAFRPAPPVEQGAPELSSSQTKPIPELPAGEYTPYTRTPEVTPQPTATDSRDIAVSALAKAFVRAIEQDGPLTVTERELGPAVTDRLIAYQLSGVNRLQELEERHMADSPSPELIQRQIEEIRKDLEVINEKRDVYSDEGLQNAAEQLFTESAPNDTDGSPTHHLLKNTLNKLTLRPQRRTTWQRLRKHWSDKFSYTIDTLDLVANLEFKTKPREGKRGRHRRSKSSYSHP